MRLRLSWPAGFRGRWLTSVCIGLGLATLAHVSLHAWHFRPLVALENWAFDSIVRLTANWDLETPPDARGLALIDIDDATWRSPTWSGGEPQRAPRKELATLIDKAFAAGAQQVVLNVLIEERDGADTSAAQKAERAEDKQFAKALAELQAKPYFGGDRHLILARSLRKRLAPDEAPAADAPKPHRGDAIDVEMRRSAAVDEAIERSGGRIDVGLPYFVRDKDGREREWQLFRIACGAPSTSAASSAVALPSVQLLVYAKNLGLGPARRESLRRMPSDATPSSECRGAASASDNAAASGPRGGAGAYSGDAGSTAASAAYWRAVRHEFCGSQPSARCPLPERLEDGEITNRLVYHHRPGGSDPRIHVLRALDLLDGSANDEMARTYLQDRVVVIAQSFAESGDRHDTPVGTMSGGWMLLNAIDSMTRAHFVEPLPLFVTASFVLLECVVVGWLFARWHSLALVVGLSVLAVLVLVPVCYRVFQYGMWLDFALPVVGIALHKLIHEIQAAFNSAKHPHGGGNVHAPTDANS